MPARIQPPDSGKGRHRGPQTRCALARGLYINIMWASPASPVETPNDLLNNIFPIGKFAARSAAKIRGFTPPKGVFAMNLGRQTPQFIAGIHPAQWPCNVPRHATACVHLALGRLSLLPRQATTRACECENSATGHIGFLEFINAAALPFACNINSKAILASIASSLEQVHGATGIHPPSQPTRYPSTHDQLDTRERVKRAFAASH